MPNLKTNGSASSNSMQFPPAKSSTDNDYETRKKSDWIEEQLQNIYAATLAEPIPERFVELLRQLNDLPGRKNE